MKLSFKLVK